MATKNIKSFLTPKLRKAALAWYARNDVLKRARVERGQYQCEQCKLSFKKEKIHVDHIDPVVDIKTGFVDWNTYIDRLLVGPEGLQALCVNCHEAKTIQEDMMREYYRIEKRDEKIKEKAAKKKNTDSSSEPKAQNKKGLRQAAKLADSEGSHD